MKKTLLILAVVAFTIPLCASNKGGKDEIQNRKVLRIHAVCSLCARIRDKII